MTRWSIVLALLLGATALAEQVMVGSPGGIQVGDGSVSVGAGRGNVVTVWRAGDGSPLRYSCDGGRVVTINCGETLDARIARLETELRIARAERSVRDQRRRAR